MIKLTSSAKWFIFWMVLSFAAWLQFTYPQFAFVDLSVDKQEAKQIARQYLSTELGVDVATFQHATVFSNDLYADRYLQRCLGFDKELEFIREHDIEFFFWKNRFYKENEKEEYLITVSAKSGEITDFVHSIEENAGRPDMDEGEPKKEVIAFLKERFGFEPEKYTILGDLAHTMDNRTDYTFSWGKHIPPIRWNREDPASGTAKLQIGAKISGHEILSFYKNHLKVPEDFGRYLERKRNIGRNLSLMFRMVFFALLVASIFFVIVRRNNLVLHTIKRFAIAITFSLFAIHFLAHINHYEGILYSYPTTTPFSSYLWRSTINYILNIFIVIIGILIPILAGESLHYEVAQEKKRGSFLHYILSTFLSRNVAGIILIGYASAMIMLGIQAVAFYFGQKYLGVWVEYTWLPHLSESVIPFFSALAIGLNAGITEEITFRLFAINLGKKVFKNVWAAVIFATVIWGYGHSSYPVYPMWFRGLEVSLMGFFLAYVYLRFGIIPVIVAHYLFDVFWVGSAFILGKAPAHLFLGSVSLLLLPLIWAAVAYVANRQEQERPMRWRLSQHQRFNLEVLKLYLNKTHMHKQKPSSQLIKEISSHGWDQAVVEIALEDLEKNEHNISS